MTSEKKILVVDDNPDVADRARASGFDAHLTKPANIIELIAMATVNG